MRPRSARGPLGLSGARGAAARRRSGRHRPVRARGARHEAPPHGGRMIFEAAADAPEGVALVEGARELGYRELAERVAGIANALCARGLSAGDTIAFRAPPTPATVALALAAIEVGAPIVPVHPRLTL